MAFDFPASPGQGQTFSPPGGPTYIYDTGRWLVQGSGSGSGLDADLLDGQHGAYYSAYANLTGKPSTFPPTLPIAESDVTNLVADLAAKATTAQLGNYLPLSGGTLSGNITAPGFVASSNATVVYGNLVNKNGRSGGFSANTCDFIWDGAGILLWVDDSNLGRINTTSDYRIKKDVAPLGSTWEQVKALRPISYTQAEFMPPMSDERAAAARVLAGSEPKSVAEPLFKNDDTPQWGFIAHELQETLLQTAATGVKDMEDGVQTPNWPPIVAALTRALQEAMQRIEALEAAAP